MRNPFPEGILQGNDRDHLYAVAVRTRSGTPKNARIDTEGGCQVTVGSSGMSYGWACTADDVKAAYAAVCKGRKADAAARSGELSRQAQRLGRDLEHQRLSPELLSRYRTFMDSGAPEELKGRARESYEKGLVRHFGRRQHEAGPDGYQMDQTDAQAQQLWASYQDPDCMADESCQARVAGTFEERVRKYQKTLAMQAQADARRRERASEEAQLQALQEAKDQQARAAKSRCAQLRGDYGTFLCQDMESSDGRIRKIGPTANQCRSIAQQYQESGC